MNVTQRVLENECYFRILWKNADIDRAVRGFYRKGYVTRCYVHVTLNTLATCRLHCWNSTANQEVLFTHPPSQPAKHYTGRVSAFAAGAPGSMRGSGFLPGAPRGRARRPGATVHNRLSRCWPASRAAKQESGVNKRRAAAKMSGHSPAEVRLLLLGRLDDFLKQVAAGEH